MICRTYIFASFKLVTSSSLLFHIKNISFLLCFSKQIDPGQVKTIISASNILNDLLQLHNKENLRMFKYALQERAKKYICDYYNSLKVGLRYFSVLCFKCLSDESYHLLHAPIRLSNDWSLKKRESSAISIHLFANKSITAD